MVSCRNRRELKFGTAARAQYHLAIVLQCGNLWPGHLDWMCPCRTCPPASSLRLGHSIESNRREGQKRRVCFQRGQKHSTTKRFRPESFGSQHRSEVLANSHARSAPACFQFCKVDRRWSLANSARYRRPVRRSTRRAGLWQNPCTDLVYRQYSKASDWRQSPRPASASARETTLLRLWRTCATS